MLENILQLIEQNDIASISEFIQERIAKNKWHWDSEELVRKAVCEIVRLKKHAMLSLFLSHQYSKTCIQGDDLLYIAAENNDLTAVKLLVEYGALENIYGMGYNPKRALCKAVFESYNEIADYLLANGTEVDFNLNVFSPSETLLSKVSFNNNRSVSEILIKHGASINIALKCNYDHFIKERNKLLYHIKENSAQYAKTSESEYADFTEVCLKELRQLVENYRQSLIILLDNAVSYHLSDLRYLDGNVKDLNLIDVRFEKKPINQDVLIEHDFINIDEAFFLPEDLERTSPERREHIQSQIDKLSLERGNSSKDPQVLRFLSLSDAVELGEEDIVKMLLDKKVNPNEYSSIILATKKGYTGIVKLLAHHPKINKADLAQALNICKDPEIEDILLSVTDIDAYSKSGVTRLQQKIIEGKFEEMIALHQRGADLHKKSRDHESSLILAIENSVVFMQGSPSKEHSKIIAYLLEQGVDANYQSPLAVALQKDNEEAVRLLLPYIDKKDIFKYLPKVMRANSWQTILLHLICDYQIDLNQTLESGLSLFQEQINRLPEINDLIETLLDLTKKLAANRLDNNAVYDCRSEIKNLEKKHENFKKIAEKIEFLIGQGADSDELTIKQYEELKQRFALLMQIMQPLKEHCADYTKYHLWQNPAVDNNISSNDFAMRDLKARLAESSFHNARKYASLKPIFIDFPAIIECLESWGTNDSAQNEKHCQNRFQMRK